jgi:hypothetical protein
VGSGEGSGEGSGDGSGLSSGDGEGEDASPAGRSCTMSEDAAVTLAASAGLLMALAM